ncbi:MAG: hypothetical protein M1820_004933 [Bogoriella megaspora]|nr:MAG: hypothetical protein M1820_004933 [Bogoriella megaspora]
MGHALGVWLRTFHSWVSEPAQIDMQKTIGKNKSMRQLKYKISYGAFLGVIQKFPEIWERYSKVLEEVRDMAAAEYTESVQDNAENNWQIIHEGPQPAGINIFIIDWELAQIGRIEYDLGQMIGDLYERKHFMNAHTALWMIQGFVFGYGVLSDDMAFRIAIHAGVHLICWYIRGNPAAPFTKPPEQIQDAMRIGTEFIVRGWTRDRAWFESSELACLFQERSKQA